VALFEDVILSMEVDGVGRDFAGFDGFGLFEGIAEASAEISSEIISSYPESFQSSGYFCG